MIGKKYPESPKGDITARVCVQCENCKRTLFRRQFEKMLRVCENCEHHHEVSGMERVAQLVDPGAFEAFDTDLTSIDPLGFVDTRTYPERLIEARFKSGSLQDGVVTGMALIHGRRLILGCLDYKFILGSMGSVVGEKLTRAIERATEGNLPLVIVSSSSGARMQESGFSLMQMGKVAAALGRLDDAGGLYISVIADQTWGGVTASFAMLGDVIIAEPGAAIGFSGTRVIEETTRQKVPKAARQSEAHLKNGFIDRIVHRRELRSEISAVIDFCSK